MVYVRTKRGIDHCVQPIFRVEVRPHHAASRTMSVRKFAALAWAGECLLRFEAVKNVSFHRCAGGYIPKVPTYMAGFLLSRG